MNLLLYKVVVTFRNPHFIILEFLGGKYIFQYFLGYKTTRGLDNKLLEVEIQEVDLCANKYRYKSISRYN